MPALPPVNNTSRFEVIGSCQGGGTWLNRLHFEHADGAFPTIFESVCEDIAAAYAEMAAYLPNEVTLNRIEGTDLDASFGEELTWTPASPALGTSTSDPLPPQVATLVNWKTGTRGRSFRGKTYLPPAAENACTASGGPDSAYLATVDNFIDAILAVGSGADLVVVSYFSGSTWVERQPSGRWQQVPTPRATPLVTAVTSGVASEAWATIRGRNNN